MNRTAWIVLVFVVSAQSLFAQQKKERLPEIVQEVFQAQTVYSQEQGELQMTWQTPISSALQPSPLLEYGITDRLQVGVQGPPLLNAPDDQPQTWEGQVYGQVIRPNADHAVAGGVSALVGKNELPGLGTLLVAAKRFANVQVHASVSAEMRKGSAPDYTYGGVALLDAGHLSPTLELVRGTFDDELRTNLVPGVYYHFNDSLESGLGVPLCISCNTTHAGVLLMVTYQREPR